MKAIGLLILSVLALLTPACTILTKTKTGGGMFLAFGTDAKGADVDLANGTARFDEFNNSKSTQHWNRTINSVAGMASTAYGVGKYADMEATKATEATKVAASADRVKETKILSNERIKTFVPPEPEAATVP